jgi:hypothetical protein
MSDLYTKTVLTVIAFALIDSVDISAFVHLQSSSFPLPVKVKQ